MRDIVDNSKDRQFEGQLVKRKCTRVDQQSIQLREFEISFVKENKNHLHLQPSKMRPIFLLCYMPSIFRIYYTSQV